MIDALLAAVPTHGVWLVAAVTFLSCLALPMPASLVMLTAGGFAAAGDLDLWQVLGAALLGAVLGDQLGYWAARLGGAPMLARLSHRKRRAALLARATAFVTRRGVLAVFLSRWLFSPLGPYANLATGAIGFGWLRFSLAGITSIGYGFAGNLTAASEFASSILGFLAAGAVAAGLGAWLITAMRHPHDAPFP
jgi:membrane protein DedA with SNARE-associated domain